MEMEIGQDIPLRYTASVLMRTPLLVHPYVVPYSATYSTWVPRVYAIQSSAERGTGGKSVCSANDLSPSNCASLAVTSIDGVLNVVAAVPPH